MSASYPPPSQEPRPRDAWQTGGFDVLQSPSFSPRVALLRQSPGWPLVPLPPLVVLVVGIAVAIAIGVVGVDRLSRASDEHAAAQAELFVATLAARIAPLDAATRLEAIRLAARRTRAEFVVVGANGDVVLDASLGAPDRVFAQKLVVRRQGEAATRIGRTRFAATRIEPPHGAGDVATAPHEPQYLIAFVREPSASEAAPAFVTALLALTTILVGVAAGVAYAMTRDAIRDVQFVTQRIGGMAHVTTEPIAEVVPVRSLDEVGLLTATFNDLVDRFDLADAKYREDVDRAGAADRDRAAFLAAVSHELRSPLNAILGFADILLAEVDGPLSPAAHEEVEQIRGSGHHLLALINDILEFSALEAGQLKISRDDVDLTELAHQVVREAAGVLAGRPVVARVEGEVHVSGFVDARRVRQILTNLVGNAIKFTARGEVVVRLSQGLHHALVSVSDTGPGISGAERAMIFEDYKQTQDERTRKRGTGLGLAIARRLVLMHGGMIKVESELGRGSTFHVYLPVGRDMSMRIALPSVEIQIPSSSPERR